MAASSPLQTLRQRKAQLLKQLVELPDYRIGSLVGRFRKCGKPWCHCAEEGSPGHGPSWSLTRSVDGKTVTTVIAPENVETVQEQVARYHRFQELVHVLAETNTRICDALLASGSDERGGPEGAEKGGSKRR